MLPKLQKGFTLIEMLVVIAIISILIGIGVNTFTIAQKKARDVRRKADLRAIQTALELYKQDKGDYPNGPSTTRTNGVTGTVGESRSNPTGWIVGLTDYIPQLPVDPLASSQTFACATNLYEDTSCYGYSYYHDSRGYSLFTRLENSEDKDTCQFSSYPNSPFGAGYVFATLTCPNSANYKTFYTVYGQ